MFRALWILGPLLHVDLPTDKTFDQTQLTLLSTVAKRDGYSLGPGAARHTLVGEADGDYLAFFDDDDRSEPDRLTVQHQSLFEYQQRTNKNHVACYASGERIYENNYRMKVEALSYSANGTIEYQTTFIVYIAVSAYPY